MISIILILIETVLWKYRLFSSLKNALELCRTPSSEDSFHAYCCLEYRAFL